MTMHRSVIGLNAQILFRALHWENWHWLVKYIPILPAWAWYCLRSGSLWFFSTSNPGLTFGGFDGENKMEMYDLLPPGTYPRTRYISCTSPFASVEDIFASSGFSFPVAVKPAIGRMGLMFRKIDTREELRRYHGIMKVDYLLQDFVSYPLEVSVFYYRLPDESKGTITGFVRKEYMEVTGDGKSTLWDLIAKYPRAAFRLEEMKTRHSRNLRTIIPAGEKYTLSHALNLSRGGKLVSLAGEKDEKLLDLIDAISHYSGFRFGRYDIRCTSVDDLKRARNFSILEFNGSGAEPHHVYGNGNTLLQALTILVRHWEVLFRISRENHRKGIPYWTLKNGLSHMIKAHHHMKILWQLEKGAALPGTVGALRAEIENYSPANPVTGSHGHQ